MKPNVKGVLIEGGLYGIGVTIGYYIVSFGVSYISSLKREGKTKEWLEKLKEKFKLPKKEKTEA